MSGNIVNPTPELTDVKMSLPGSQDGDVYFRQDGKLARLAIGATGEVLTVNGAGTFPEWAASGVSWNDTRSNGTGVGLTHTIGANAASGVQSFKTTLNNTQSNALTVNEIHLGTSALAHKGLKITASGLSTSQRGIEIDLINGTGVAYDAINNDEGVCFRSYFTNNGDFNRKGFSFTSGNSNVRGIAVDLRTSVTGTLTDLKAITVNFISNNNNAGRTLNIAEIYDQRTSGSQDITDDFNILHVRRITSYGGTNTVNQRGAVLRVENLTSAGFNEESVVPLEIIQDADSTGVPLEITQNAVVSTNFKKCIEIGGLTIWISDGTTAEGNLTGVEGDICLNGGTGAGQTAYCDAAGTNWTDM